MALDDHPEGRHYGLVLNNKILGAGSCGPQELEGEPGLRLYAMAMVPELRGRGLWHLLHDACVTRAEELAHTLLWARVRSSAYPVYAAVGIPADR